MKIALYTLTSSLHDRNPVDDLSLEFLSAIEAILGYKFDFRGDSFATYGQSDLDVIFIRTGGSEGLFKQVFPTLSGRKGAPAMLPESCSCPRSGAGCGQKG